nr:hypothetical protein [Tanacetum cinerariifolium]
MTEQNDYIFVTRKSCISNDNDGKMIERNFVEIQGTFLIKVRDNAFNRAIGENVFEHINKFLEVVGLVGTYEEYELNNHVTRDHKELWLDNGVPYQLCDHICETCRFKNGITTCSSDIDGFCGGELPGMVRVGSMTYFQDHKWYDELVYGKLKNETLAFKAKVEESWGNATPGVMKFCTWLINSFGNFQELDYDVLVKLQEYWWKINADEVTPFTRSESYGHEPYANMKTKKTRDPYLDINCISCNASNVKETQENQGYDESRDDPTLEPSVFKIRRFKMMKYSFNVDEEYIAIKESEYLNHSKDNLDAYQELLCIINEGWIVTTIDEE